MTMSTFAGIEKCPGASRFSLETTGLNLVFPHPPPPMSVSKAVPVIIQWVSVCVCAFFINRLFPAEPIRKGGAKVDTGHKIGLFLSTFIFLGWEWREGGEGVK